MELAGEPGGREVAPVDHEIVIIGAGIGGIGVGIKLREAGFDDFVLLERADDIGGTWRDNTYPGVASDVPAQVYQYRFALNPDWSSMFAPGREILDYIRRLADEYEIIERVRCRCEVLSRTWDEDRHRWRLETPGGEVTARYVISAIGAFIDPKANDIPGVEDFAGKTMHTAAWDHDYDLAGKRVAVVGTGATAVQMVPEVAKVAAHLDVYQRTPIWVGPKMDPRMPRAVRWMFRRFPSVQERVRRRLSALTELTLIGGLLSFRHKPFFSKFMSFTQREIWYRIQVRDPVLRRALTPDYDFGCKRPSFSNDYLRTFTRDHVELVTTPIDRIAETGIRTTDGRKRDVDVLVLATGFRMATNPENYRRTPVRGRNGFDLATFYEENRVRSYEGVSLPGLPNHFTVFGPYGWIGATWHQLVELAAEHAIRVMRAADRIGATMVEVRDDACNRWTEQMRENFGDSLFVHGSCATANSYYFDHRGDIPYLRPTSSADAAVATASFPLDDYHFVGPDGAPATVPHEQSADPVDSAVR